MRHGHNVAALMFLGPTLDRNADTLHQIDEAFAVGRAFVGGGIPERVRLLTAIHQEGVAIKTLPIAEVLFGKILVLLQFRRRLKISGGEDGLRCLLRARQMAAEPDRLARQKRRQAGEDARITAIARQVALAVDAAFIDNRRMPDPPPACANEAVPSPL